MGRRKYLCAYCDKSCEDSQDARKRHNNGRSHRANVKLWFDSFADQEKRAIAARNNGALETAVVPDKGRASGRTDQEQHSIPVGVAQAFDWRALPPSMMPPPPEAFLYYERTDWG